MTLSYYFEAYCVDDITIQYLAYWECEAESLFEATNMYLEAMKDPSAVSNDAFEKNLCVAMVRRVKYKDYTYDPETRTVYITFTPKEVDEME